MKQILHNLDEIAVFQGSKSCSSNIIQLKKTVKTQSVTETKAISNEPNQ